MNRVTKKPIFGSRFGDVSVMAASYDHVRLEGEYADGASSDRVAYRVTAAYENSNSDRPYHSLERSAFSPSLSYRPGGGRELLVQADILFDDRLPDRGIPSFQGAPLDEAQPYLLRLSVGRLPAESRRLAVGHVAAVARPAMDAQEHVPRHLLHQRVQQHAARRRHSSQRHALRRALAVQLERQPEQPVQPDGPGDGVLDRRPHAFGAARRGVRAAADQHPAVQRHRVDGHRGEPAAHATGLRHHGRDEQRVHGHLRRALRPGSDLHRRSLARAPRRSRRRQRPAPRRPSPGEHGPGARGHRVQSACRPGVQGAAERLALRQREPVVPAERRRAVARDEQRGSRARADDQLRRRREGRSPAPSPDADVLRVPAGSDERQDDRSARSHEARPRRPPAQQRRGIHRGRRDRQRLEPQRRPDAARPDHPAVERRHERRAGARQRNRQRLEAQRIALDGATRRRAA